MEIKTFLFTMEEFNHHLQKYLEGCQGLIDAAGVDKKLVLHPGRRYVKLVEQQPTKNGSYQDRGVFGFVDKTSGAILRAESYNKPSRHARGNIFEADFGLSSTLWTGPKYQNS